MQKNGRNFDRGSHTSKKRLDFDRFHDCIKVNAFSSRKTGLQNSDRCSQVVVSSGLTVQVALVIRGGYVPQKYREYQNLEYQVQ
jgi:hypothetical protein